MKAGRPRTRALVLALVLGLALTLRWTTLEIPHYGSDEPWCEGLAASLLATGWQGYTVQHVGARVLDHRDGGLALLELGPDPRERAEVLEFYATDHQDPLVGDRLSARAPLFPGILAASVASLGSGAVRVVAVNQAALAGPTHLAYEAAVAEPSSDWLRAQLPVVLPSLLASLLSVALAFAAALGCASSRGAVVAALALATAPLDVWCAHRVTADTLTVLTIGLVALAAAGAVGAEGRRGLGLAALVGVLGGLATLAKSSGVLVVPAYALAEGALLLRQGRSGREVAWRAALGRTIVVGAFLALAGLWWTLLVLARSGDLARSIGYGGIGLPPEVLAGRWPTFTRARPFWVIPASTAVLAPLLGLGIAALLGSAARASLRREGPASSRERALFSHASLALVFLVVTVAWPSKENRFILPAYVPFAVGTALATDRALAVARRHFGKRAGTAAVAVLVGSLAAVSAVAAHHLGPSGRWELTPLERALR